MDVEAVRLVLNDSSTGIVTLTVVDALPFAMKVFWSFATFST